MKDIEFKGAPGSTLFFWGMGLAIVPFVLAVLDVIIRRDGGANIGLGILALVVVPAGLVLGLLGLVRILFYNLRKK